MKRTIVAAALALSFAATASYAQTSTPEPTPPKPPAGGAPEAAPPPPPHHPGPEAKGHPDEMGGMKGKWQRDTGMKHHMMMMSKGARIRVRDGDLRVSVKCAEDDSTAECGQTVIRILKEMQSSDQSGYQDQNDEDSGNGGDDSMTE
jgi:hypothetical protein